MKKVCAMALLGLALMAAMAPAFDAKSPNAKLSVAEDGDGLLGAWITNPEINADVHVYTKPDMVVIGWNKNTQKMRFTDLALTFTKGKDGPPTAIIQMATAKGQSAEPEFLTFEGRKLEKLAVAMQQFLKRAEQIARHE